MSTVLKRTTDKLVKQFLVLLTFMFVSANVYAGWVGATTARMAAVYNPAAPTVPSSKVTVGTGTANATIANLPSGSGFNDIQIPNIIELGIDVHYQQYLTAATNCTVTLTIEKYNSAGTLVSTETGKTLTVVYDPLSGVAKQDKAVYVFSGYYKLKTTITAITVNSVSVNDLPFNMYVDMSLDIDRIYDFTSNSTVPCTLSVATVDLNTDAIPDELNVTWPTVTGAEEYQLEWTFVNNYGVTTSTSDDIAATALNYTFKNNATRITTKSNSYRLPVLFDRGYVIFRLRAIGKKTTTPYDNITGVWSSAPESGYVSAVNSAHRVQILNTWVHENNKNWQVTSTFAEEGKKKEVVSYFDGSLRNRQTVTRINTDENVIVGETYYDYQGRPAITVLPVPVEKPSGAEQRLKFYDGFNKDNSAGEYNQADFDKDVTPGSCTIAVGTMSNNYGASKYYSPNNIDKIAHQAFVPDAELYPFTQVEYTPDNTGRIKRQGGVGDDFQLGSNHETKYYYGQPSQEQLDRLFASEVGDATHYKKNLIIDPNGQVSVSYLDQEGRVVATALAGDAPTNLQAIPSESSAAFTQTVDLFKKDPLTGISTSNVKNIETDAIIFNTQYMVSSAGNHTFHYDFDMPPYDEACLAASVCFNCIYDLELTITDECGAPVPGMPIATTVGSFTVVDGKLVFNTTCASNANYSYTSTTPGIYLNVGTYTISKKLKVNQQAVDYYVQKYLDKAINTCAQDLSDFQDEYLSAIDFSNCEIDCDECIAALGDRDEYVSSGKGTALDYDYQMEECKKMCKKYPSDCEIAFTQMKMDVSPGGQYAEYLTSTGSTSPSAFPLSVLNSSNLLPAHVLLSSSGYWQYPKTILNGVTYSNYVNEDGSLARATIVYNPTSSVAYSPAVVNTGLVTVDASGVYSTPIQNLANVADFIARFKPEWALGLVTYHPEYLYYQKCAENGVVQSGHPISSDAYDEAMMNATTFALANSADPTKDFISSGNIPFNSSTVTTANIYDPWRSTIGSTYQTLFTNRFNSYMNVSGAKNMYEYAAITARCGTPYVAFTATCDDFGTGGTTAILDLEWNNYKKFYQSLKNEIKQKIADDAALITSTDYGLNDCIGNADDFNPYISGMFTFTPGSLADFFAITIPYFNDKQPCSYTKRALYASKVPRFPSIQSLPGYSTTTSTTLLGEEAAYQIYLQTGQCPKAHAIETIFNAFAIAGKINAASENMISYPEFNSYYVMINNYAPTVAISTGANYDWKATVISTDVLKIEWKDAASVLKQTFTITKPSSVTSWGDIVSFGGLEATSATVFTIQAKLASTGGYVTITATTDLNMFNCTFAEVCEPNEFALDLQNLMSAMAINGHLTSSTAYNLTTSYSSLLTTTIKGILGTPNTAITWKYNSTTKVFTLKDNATTNKRIDFTIIDPASPVFTSVKYYADINSDGYNIFTMKGYDASGTLIHTLRLSAIAYDDSNVASVLFMGSCDLPVPLACLEDEYKLARELRKLLAERLVYAAAQTTYPTTIDFFASPFLSTMLTSYFPPLPSPINMTYTPDNTGPLYEDKLLLTISGCNIDMYMKTTNNVHFDGILTAPVLIGYGTPDISGAYTQFKLVVTFSGGTTDTVYGVSCIPLKNCAPCGDAAAGKGPAPVFASTTLECTDMYTLYSNAVTAFNAVAGSLGLSTITAIGSGYFNYNGYCGCANTYVSLLQSIMSGAMSGTGTDYNDLNAFCTDALETPCLPDTNLFSVQVVFPEYEISASDTTACELQLIQLALANAANAYNEYVQDITTQIAAAYKAHCLSTVENFTAAYTDKEYHFTLYYYDQAGNLVKTIPPAGVELLNLSATYSGATTIGTAIKEDRSTNGTRRVYTTHRLATTYEYNSLNQLVKQNMPDHDAMDIWIPGLTAGLDTNMVVTKIQFFSGNKGFLSGYIPGNRGVLYTTNDAGYSWKRVEDVVAATINKVHMVTTSNGYAVGNNGVILRTTNGGSTWEMLNTYASNVYEDIIDVVFEDANKGVALLKGTTSPVILGITSAAGATPVFTKFGIALLTFGSGGYINLTGITYNPNSSPARYILVSKYRYDSNSPETGIIYHSDATAVTTTLWTANSTIIAPDINKVSYNSTLNKYYTGGVTGQMQKITLGGTNLDQPANVIGNIIDIHFATANDGLAIIEDVVNQGQIYRTSDAGLNWTLLSAAGDYFKSLNFYEKVVDASGDIYKFTAVGLTGKVKRVILQVNNPGGIIDMPDATSTTLNTSWSFVYGGKVHALVAGDGGKLYYCADASATSPVWTTQTITGITGSDKILKITGFVDGTTGAMVTVFLTENGATYKLFKMYKATATGLAFGNTTSQTLAAGVIKDLSASDISSSVHMVYFFNNTTRQLYKVPVAISTAANTVTALTNAIPAYTGSLITLATTLTTDLVVAGTNGLTYRGVLNSTTAPTSVTWTAITNNLQPLALTDVQKAPTTGGYTYATTINGDIFENYTATSWRKLQVKSFDKINAITFNTTPTDGIIAADNGKLYNFTITPGVSVVLTQLNTASTANFKDVAINGTVAAAVADDGLILVNNTYPSNTFVPAVNQSSVPLYGVSTKPSSTEIIAVGSNSQIRKIAGNTSTKVTQVFTPNLNSVHFFNTQEGYIAGDWLTARHTSDGGATWQVANITTGWSFTSSTLPNLKGVFTSATNTATLVGTQGKAYSASNNTLTAITVTGTTSTYTFNDVEVTGSSIYIVGKFPLLGTDRQALLFYNGSTWTGLSGGVTGELFGVHTFARNNSFIAVGRAATSTPVVHYGRTTILTTTTPGVTSNLKDVHFIDDLNGYVVGDNGAIVKSKDFAYSPTGTMDYTTMNWTAGLSPGPLSGQTVTANMDIRSVFAINHTSAMVGGLYTSPKVYARLITDESLRYSTKFWYDKLGRIVVTQNTRQFNLTTKAYSYTVFDAMGRMVEAGEKSENTGGSEKKFADIFGTQVNNHWNQNVIDDARLNTWITTASGTRSEVTRSYYDKVETAIGATLPGSFTQTELRKRISCVAYYPTYSGTTTAYDHATHYSYDIHSKTKSLLQENRKLAVGSGAGTNVTDERYNRIDYQYDLISGNVQKVSYETGKADQWYHKYNYDGDNRILDVSTSDNDQIWDKDAKYIYYDHGPLARTEYGQNNVQAIDNAYTLIGWLKGVNSNDLSTKRDIGQDGYLTGTSPNQKFAFDVAGYTLNYFNGDYKPIDQTNKWNTVTDRFESDKTSSNIDITSSNGLYNGNIKAMVTTITNPSTNAILPQATLYGYDQLSRLKDSKAFANLNTSTNVWGNTTYTGLYENYFRYDANGNITKQVRRNETGTAIDAISYGFYKGNSGKILKNRLYHIDDAVSSGTFSDDIDDMGTFDSTNAAYNTAYNYSYDAEGRLIKDIQEKITSIKWRVDGKVAEVIRTASSGRKALKFDYDAMGHRIAKHQYNEAGTTWEKSTYYVLDADGNIMATYEKINPGTASMKVKERMIYGSSRMGLYIKQVEMISAPTPSANNFIHETALRYYELTNHLSSVLSVITDRKKPIDDGDHDSGNDGINESNGSLGAADNQVDYYRSEIVSSNDYSPFGVYQTGRTFSSSNYEIGFNGMRKDSELKGEGNSYDFGARLFDSRVGRWLTVDPLQLKYAGLSSYQYTGNSPIFYVDPNGKEIEGFLSLLSNAAWGKSVTKVNTSSKTFQSVINQFASTTKGENPNSSGANGKYSGVKVEFGTFAEPHKEGAKDNIACNMFMVKINDEWKNISEIPDAELAKITPSSDNVKIQVMFNEKNMGTFFTNQVVVSHEIAIHLDNLGAKTQDALDGKKTLLELKNELIGNSETKPMADQHHAAIETGKGFAAKHTLVLAEVESAYKANPEYLADPTNGTPMTTEFKFNSPIFKDYQNSWSEIKFNKEGKYSTRQAFKAAIFGEQFNYSTKPVVVTTTK